MTGSSRHLSEAELQALAFGSSTDLEAAAHAKTCDSCAGALASYRLLGQAFSELPAIDADEEFVSGVMVLVEHEPRVHEVREAQPQARFETRSGAHPEADQKLRFETYLVPHLEGHSEVDPDPRSVPLPKKPAPSPRTCSLSTRWGADHARETGSWLVVALGTGVIALLLGTFGLSLADGAALVVAITLVVAESLEGAVALYTLASIFPKATALTVLLQSLSFFLVVYVIKVLARGDGASTQLEVSR